MNPLTIFQLPKILILAMTTIPAEEDMLIVKSSFILTSMGKKQKIKLNETDVKATLEWLLNAIRINLCVGLCDILRAVEVILKGIDSDIPQVKRESLEFIAIKLKSASNFRLLIAWWQPTVAF